jgi:hypothetical protein
MLCISLQASPKVIAKFGSSECPWSEELKKEVWDSSTFQALLEGAGVAREETQVQEVSEMVPVFILISSAGEEIGRLGFLPISSEKYVDLFKEMLSIHTLCQSLSNLELEQLLHLYRKAGVLHMAACEKRILQEGLKKDQGVDFLIAQYASVIREHPRKARSIKQEIRARKKDQITSEWELALISFQARQEKMVDSAQIVLPIKKFLRKFGAKNSDYAWKCHFILAEFYRSKKEVEKMNFHMQKAREGAPEEFKKIIESS